MVGVRDGPGRAMLDSLAIGSVGHQNYARMRSSVTSDSTQAVLEYHLGSTIATDVDFIPDATRRSLGELSSESRMDVSG